MKILVLSLICTCSFLTLFSQNSVKGIITDTTSNVNLENATICILNSRDSSLYNFTRTASNGAFFIRNLPLGRFILLVSYPGYADYVENFAIDSTSNLHDFGRINMILRANLLADVLIKGNAAAIKIKGDTTEYNANRFVIQPNAKVEDLLKQLPGIQIDKNGRIIAHGETVNKVLVDGEEFFGDDPTLVTKNLRGDMVDKVQLYDKKSDQAAFTGIDDGVKIKTINLKLKEDKKNGYFGKVDAGGSPQYHQEQGMFNRFTTSKKFAVYGTVGNTGKTGLNGDDSNRYGASNSDDSGGGNDEIRYNGQGIPMAETAGAHYDAKWNDGKESINTNYKIGFLSIEGKRNNLVQNNLPVGILNNNENQIFNNDLFRQKLDAIYQIRLDSTSNLKLSIDGSLRNTNANTEYNGVNLRGTNSLQNTSVRGVTNKGSSKNLNFNAFWSKKTKKSGRTLSLAVGSSISENNSTGYLNSFNTYYNNQSSLDKSQNIDSIERINQLKINESSSTGLNANITFSEPLNSRFSIIFNYGFNLNKSLSDRQSFNQSVFGVYDVPDRVFSNNFELNQLSNQGGATFSYNKKRTIINAGLRLISARLDQRDLINNQNYNRAYLNFSPQAGYSFRISQQASFRFNYNGFTNQPGIEALQPIRVNTDPLNITLGNPDLKPYFSNNFIARYNTSKVLNGTSLFLSAFYSFTLNAIVTSRATDSAGKSTYQSVNLDNQKPSNYILYATFNKRINSQGLNIGFTLNLNGNTYFGYINNLLNTIKSNGYSAGLTFSKNKAKKYDFYFSVGPGYTTGESSIQRHINNNGWGLNTDGSFVVYLPGKMQINSDAGYEYKDRTLSFNENFDRLIWNTSISKRFLKTENLKLSISGNDLLNQNIGFRRSTNSNTVSQSTYTTIKRYFLLSLIWDFNKMGAGTKPSDK